MIISPTSADTVARAGIIVTSAKVVDTIGAGDAFFAFAAPLALSGLPAELVLFAGNAAGAIAVKIVGNRRPVEKGEFLEFVATLLEAVRIPSVSLTGEGIGEAVDFLAGRMKRWGFDVQVFPTASQPIVYGEIGPRDAPFTWLTYGHYDVYPADAKAEGWKTDPWQPVVDGDRIWGRGAGDNKGQHLALLNAIALYRELHGELPIRIKVVLEGDEETGSRPLPGFVGKHRDMLRAELCCYSDGPMMSPILRAKEKSEAFIQAYGMTHTIIRPGGYGDKEVSGKIAFGEGGKITGRVTRDQIAKVCVDALTNQGMNNRTFEVVDAATVAEDRRHFIIKI